MQDPAEVVKITCARFCISYPGLAPIGIGGLNKATLLRHAKYYFQLVALNLFHIIIFLFFYTIANSGLQLIGTFFNVKSP